MRTEEKLLNEFLKENNLYSLYFAWGTNAHRYYGAYNSNNEEVEIHYDVENEKITSRIM